MAVYVSMTSVLCVTLLLVSSNEAVTCGGSLIANNISTTLTSPVYPSRYMNNLDCVWTIRTFWNNIKVDVITSDIEEDNLCSLDYVEVTDGSRTSSPKLGKFCGTDTPTYYSTGQYVTITFHTDRSFTGKGFSLQYEGGTFGGTDHDGFPFSAIIGGILVPLVSVLVISVIVVVKRSFHGFSPVRGGQGNISTVSQEPVQTTATSSRPVVTQMHDNLEGPGNISTVSQEPVQTTATSSSPVVTQMHDNLEGSGNISTVSQEPVQTTATSSSPVVT